MAIISTLTDAINFINTLYEADSTAPTSGDDDFTVWTRLLNLAINVWENEEGVLWNELFVKLADAPDGDKTTNATNSYDCPTDFKFPASAYVWLGSGTNKTAYKVIKQSEIQLYENNSEKWCYFLMDKTPTLEFNPNLTISTGETISYNYYKKAAALSSGSDTFEMSDPMFAVYYAVAELSKEEGNPLASSIASQKLEAMKTANAMTTWFEDDTLQNKADSGFGT